MVSLRFAFRSLCPDGSPYLTPIGPVVNLVNQLASGPSGRTKQPVQMGPVLDAHPSGQLCTWEGGPDLENYFPLSGLGVHYAR